MYSVNSGYHVALSTGEESSSGILGGNAQFFNKLWHLNIQNKIKVLLWKAIHELIPARFHLAARCQMSFFVLNITFMYCGIARESERDVG